MCVSQKAKGKVSLDTAKKKDGKSDFPTTQDKKDHKNSK
jgi:hypothetical protein